MTNELFEKLNTYLVQSFLKLPLVFQDKIDYRNVLLGLLNKVNFNEIIQKSITKLRATSELLKEDDAIIKEASLILLNSSYLVNKTNEVRNLPFFKDMILVDNDLQEISKITVFAIKATLNELYQENKNLFSDL